LPRLVYYLQVIKGDINDVPALDWWKAQQHLFPDLSVMVRDIMSVPATSTPPERAFSSSGMLVSNRRTRLGADTIEACMIAKNWL